MKRSGHFLENLLGIALGSALFALGFALFLEPNQIHAGGVSGLSLLIAAALGRGSVGLISLIINIPLFILGYRHIGRRFFYGSLLGMALSSVLIDVFAAIPMVDTEPLVSVLFGGALCGFGLGLVFHAGASTGGTDIAGRLLKRKFRSFSMGRLMMSMDLVTVVLTAVVFRDVNKALYSALTLYVTSKVMDSVLYSFDYSRVALIVTDEYEAVARAVDEKLDRGVTFLRAQGYYTRQDKFVLLCAIKKQQLPELKDLVAELDPNAFVILQDAHQVLGDGFKRHDEDSLT